MVYRRAILGIAALAPFAQAAQAQARPIRIIVAYPPGGASDLTIRTLAPHVGESLGRPLVVENRGGANGAIAMQALARAAPDGGTFAIGAESVFLQTLVRSDLGYDAQRDLEPVAMLVAQPIVFAVHPSLGVATLAELIALVRRRADPLPYVTAGQGGTQTFAAAMLAEGVGIRLEPVTYRGGGQAINDLVGGQVPLGVLGTPPVVSHAREGRLRILAVASPRRALALPEVPTVAEATGLADYGFEQWQGVLAPKRTPPEIILRMNEALRSALRQDEAQRTLRQLGLEIVGETPAEFAARLAREGRIWMDAATRLGLAGG